MRKSRLIALLLALIPFSVITVFIGIPALMALAFSLGYGGGPNTTIAQLGQNETLADHSLTLSIYQSLWQDHSFQQDFWSTIWVTIASVLLILAVGWSLALYLRFSRGWLVQVISSLYLVPLFVPVVIASYAIVTFWNANGYLSALIAKIGLHFPGFSYTMIGIVIGQLWVNIPFATLLLASGLQGVPDVLIESARDVGASMPRILVRIIVPLNIMPTVIVGTFTGIGVLGSFTIPYIIGPTAPTLLGVTMSNYYTSFNEPQQAEAMAVLVFLLAAGLGVFYVWANVRSDQKAGAAR
ncbi:MAG TPA: ABC transporter permease subunit [Ktedonosporobacter sp.]|nr:ABC transporter permease subunit [Ktedonosporobacter sp.]